MDDWEWVTAGADQQVDGGRICLGRKPYRQRCRPQKFHFSRVKFRFIPGWQDKWDVWTHCRT